MLPPGGVTAVPRGLASVRGGLGAPPPPPRSALAGPAAARQRRPLGPRILARTRFSRPRHVPGGGGGNPA